MTLGLFANGQAESTVKEIDFWHTIVPIDGYDKVQEFVDAYNAEHPGVKVNATLISWDDLRKTIVPALRSGEGPDIFIYTPGPGYIGLLGDAGLVLDLEEPAEKYGWKEIIPSWQLEQTEVNGKLYGIAAAEQLLGVYYNKSLYAELGLEVPTTYDEFVENLRIIKEKTDVVPLAIDAKDQWPSFHQGTAFYTSFVGADDYNAAVASQSGFNGEKFVQAIDAIVALYKEGLTTAEPNALTNNDAHVEFIAGKVAHRLTGTWAISTFGNKMGDDVGFFALPPANGNSPALAGNVSDLLTVSSTAEYVDETLEFMDAFINDESMWTGTFGVPVAKGLTRNNFDNDLTYDAYKAIQNASGVATTIDTVMEQDFNDLFKNEYQKLFADKTTAEGFSNTLEALLAK